MRKRINSEQKYDYAGLQTFALDIKNQVNPETQYQRGCCPPRPPKPDRTNRSRHSIVEPKELTTAKVRQFPNPIMKQLRRLILNQVDSGDRLYHYLSLVDHKHVLKLYFQDRTKLIKYLNSLIIREVNLDSIKLRLQNQPFKNQSNQFVPLIENTQDSLEKTFQESQRTKKRCSSEAGGEKKQNTEMQEVKKRLNKLEKECKHCSHHTKNRKSKLKINQHIDQHEAEPQKLLINAKILLQAVLKQNKLKQDYLIIEKTQIENIIQNLQKVIALFKLKTDKIAKQLENEKTKIQKLQLQMQKCKEELPNQEEMKQSLRKARMSHNDNDQYEELKTKVNRLYDELADLVTEVENKDEVIQYLKIENNNLRNDLVGLEDLNRTTRAQQRALTDFLETLQEKGRYYQEELASKEMEISQTKTDLDIKEQQIMKLSIEFQTKLAIIQEGKAQLQSKIKNLQSIISTLNQQKQLILIERDISQQSLKKSEKENNKLKEQAVALEQKYEQIKNQKSVLMINFDNFKESMSHLQNQNIALHKKLQWISKNSSQWFNQSQCQATQTLKGATNGNFSALANQSNTDQKEIANFTETNEKEIEKKTLSERGQKNNEINEIKKHPESQYEAFDIKKVKIIKPIKPSTSIEDVYSASDKEAKIQRMENQLNEGSQEQQKVIFEVHSDLQKEDNLEKASRENKCENHQTQLNRLLEVEYYGETPKAKRSNQKDLPIIVLSDSIDRAAHGGANVTPRGIQKNQQQITPSHSQLIQRMQKTPSSKNSKIINRNIFIRWGSNQDQPMTPTPRSTRAKSCPNQKF